MTCEDVHELLGPFYDNEIGDVLVSKQVADHLETCPSCAQELAALARVSQAVRSSPPRFQASESLKRRIEEATGVEPVAESAEWWRIPHWRPRLWIPLAATMLVGCVLIIIVVANRPSARLEEDLVADHVRSLQASHLFDVASSDQHTVKPWFQGRLDFSPSVPNLSDDGFALLGGRMDYVGNRPAAALVYQRGRHMINVFVSRALSSPTPSLFDDRDGFHLVGWRSKDLTYWAVSDVNANDLVEFKESFIHTSRE